MQQPTRQAVMESQSVRNFCKDILRGSIGKDPLDALKDAELALTVLRNEYDAEVAHWDRFDQVLKEYKNVLSAQGR